MPKGTPITADQISLLHESDAKGMSMQEMKDVTGMSFRSIAKYREARHSKRRKVTDEMAAEIVQRLNEGWLVKDIAKEFGVHRTTISMYRQGNVSERAKEVKQRRLAANRARYAAKPWLHRLHRKVTQFKAIRNRRSKGKYVPVQKPAIEYNTETVIAKLMPDLKDVRCYLTGRLIDLGEPKSYHLDHIMPRARGGSVELENMAIACAEANQSKGDRTVREHLQYCKEVLLNFGYQIEGPKTRGCD